MAPNLFANIRYHLSVTLRTERRAQLAEVLNASGAKPVPLDDLELTHFITNSPPSDDSIEVVPDKAQLVTPTWVERSRVIGTPQAPEYYSPDPALLFSGVTATATDLSPRDLELLAAAITALGGQWRDALTRDVTHVFALSTGSQKYETAMYYREKTGMIVLVPHWFEDTIRLGIKGLPTQEYEWPEPAVFKGPFNAEEQKEADMQKSYKISSEKKAYFDTVLASSNDLPFTRAPPRNVWNGLKVLLSASLDLSDSQRDAHEEDIRREGGIVVELETAKSGSPREIVKEEAEKVAEADVLVTRFRAGKAFVEAFRAKKTIGSLAWLWYVRASGTLSRPTDHLLHFPIPKKPIESFSSHVITITNYTGKHRDYLKKLISTLGAEFTPSMTSRNTVVIAAYISGIKTEKAVSWSIPVVNHRWLEESFAQWRALTPAQERYIIYPPRVDFSQLLADPELGGRVELEVGELAELEAEDEFDDAPLRPPRSASGPVGTANSAQEVEEEIGDVSVGGYLEMEMEMRIDDDDEDQESEDADKMDVDDAVRRKKSKKSKSEKPKSAWATKVVKAEVRNRDDSDDDAIRKRATASRSPAKRSRDLVRQAGRRVSEVKPALVSEPESQDEDVAKLPSPSKVKAMKGKQPQKEPQAEPVTPRTRKLPQPPSDDEDEDENQMDVDLEPNPPPRATKGGKPSLQVKKNTSKPRKAVEREDTEDDLESEDEDDVQPKRPSREYAKTSRSTVSASVEPSAPVSPAKSTRTPKKQMSVLLPTVAAVYSPNKAGSSSPSKKAARTESIRVQAAEAPKQSPKKGGHTSSSTAKRDKVENRREARPATPPAKAGRVSTGSVYTESLAESSNMDTSSLASMALTRTPSRRSAANKATQRLRDEIMPDVLNFQREMKNKNVRPAWEDEKPSAKGKGKERHVDDVSETKTSKAEKSKGKKRASAAHEDASVVDEDEPEQKRPRTNSTSARKNKTAAPKGRQPKQDQESSEEEDSTGTPEPRSRHKPSGASKGEAGAPHSKASTVGQPSRSHTKTIRIMTTQVTISDDVTRVLTKMGVKMATKPSECTHLVAKSLVRTEKFLCAMAVAPFIVSEKWILSSAAAKQLLPEEHYALQDPENEKKYGFQLSDALGRAKANGGKLFAGMTFYVTPKVPVDAKLLKNVVTAGGGQLLAQTPTVRILNGNENRFVISSQADISIWRPLAHQGYPIYNQELILTGALRQELDWDNSANKVSTSS